MENIIDKIADIDKKAFEIKNQTEKMIKENGKKLNDKLNEIEKKELIRAREKAKKKYEKLIKSGETKSKEIKLATKKECSKLEENFIKIHKKLEKEILRDLLIKKWFHTLISIYKLQTLILTIQRTFIYLTNLFAYSYKENYYQSDLGNMTLFF